MDTQNKYDQFFQQMKDKAYTAENILNAIKANGNALELKPFYLAVAKDNNADIETELDNLIQVQEKAQKDKDAQETAESIKIEKARTKIIASKALMKKTFPPRKWVVDGLIGTGLTLFSGVPKIGKSWLTLALSEAASTGRKFLDFYDVKKTPTLHLSLEDGERSIKERRGIMASRDGGCGYKGNNDLFFATEWDTGSSGLETYLRAHNEIKFVIIDTLGLFMPDIEDMSEYAPTVKAMNRIKKIADGLDIAILVVHHAKKGNSRKEQGDWMEQSLGSQGIAGSADTVILLQRDIDDKTGERKNTGKLNATGRNVKDVSQRVIFSPKFGTWSINKNSTSTEATGEEESVVDETGDVFDWNPLKNDLK